MQLGSCFQYSVRVVDMIPPSIQTEELANPEPTLAVNPANPDEMVATALYIWSGSSHCDSQTAGVLRTIDRGRTWAVHCALALTATDKFAGDMSLAFSDNGTRLIGAYNRSFSASSPWFSLRFFSTVPSTLDKWVGTDLTVTQPANLMNSHLPWVSASTDPSSSLAALGGVHLVLYTGGPIPCNSAVVYMNRADPATFKSVCLATRTSLSCGWQSTPVVRTAVHADGTMYTVIYRVRAEACGGTSATQDVVVYRSDPGEAAAFGSLSDTPPSGSPDACDGRDGMLGFRLVRCVEVPNDYLFDYGQERRMRTHLAVAIDPNDNGHLFVAWGGSNDPDDTNLHLTESQNRGADSLDVGVVAHAINPALAVASDGRVGFAYQRLDGGNSGRWITELRIYSKGHPHVLEHVVQLSSTSATDPDRCTIVPYIGDYMQLVSVGKHFYGVFSAAGYQDLANFPSGLTATRAPPPQQRNPVCADDPANVDVTIDPYFYAVERQPFATALSWSAAKALVTQAFSKAQ